MQENKPGALENDQQANYNPTARNFDQEDVIGPSQPINNVNKEAEEAPKHPSATVPQTNADTNDESPRDVNWAPPEEEGRNENSRNEDLPNAPSE